MLGSACSLLCDREGHYNDCCHKHGVKPVCSHGGQRVAGTRAWAMSLGRMQESHARTQNKKAVFHCHLLLLSPVWPWFLSWKAGRCILWLGALKIVQMGELSGHHNSYLCFEAVGPTVFPWLWNRIAELWEKLFLAVIVGANVILNVVLGNLLRIVWILISQHPFPSTLLLVNLL